MYPCPPFVHGAWPYRYMRVFGCVMALSAHEFDADISACERGRHGRRRFTQTPKNFNWSRIRRGSVLMQLLFSLSFVFGGSATVFPSGWCRKLMPKNTYSDDTGSAGFNVMPSSAHSAAMTLSECFTAVFVPRCLTLSTNALLAVLDNVATLLAATSWHCAA